MHGVHTPGPTGSTSSLALEAERVRDALLGEGIVCFASWEIAKLKHIPGPKATRVEKFHQYLNAGSDCFLEEAGTGYKDNITKFRVRIPQMSTYPDLLGAERQLSYVEHINVKALHEYVQRGTDRRLNYAATLLHRAKLSNGIVHQLYRYPIACLPGRRFAVGATLQSVTRECREKACIGIVIDMENCYVVLAYQLARKLVLSYNPTLCVLGGFHEYIVRRSQCLTQIQEAFRYTRSASVELQNQSCSRAHAKELFIRILHGGARKVWMTCHKLWPVRGHILTFLDAFEKDAIACVEIIRQARPDLVAMFDQMQRPRPELTCFSYALAEVEDAVLASVEQQLKTMGYTVAAPCFDGLIISLPAEHVLESFDLAFLAELKTSVRDDLDFEVDFTVRRFQGDDTDAEIANAIEAEISHESSSFWYEVGLNSVGAGVPIVEVGGRLVCVPSAVAAYARWQGRAEIAQQLEDMCSQTSGPYTCQRVMAACSKVHISEAVVHVHVGAGKPSGNTASILTDQHGYILQLEKHIVGTVWAPCGHRGGHRVGTVWAPWPTVPTTNVAKKSHAPHGAHQGAHHIFARI
jgi:hypothetical protein